MSAPSSKKFNVFGLLLLVLAGAVIGALVWPRFFGGSGETRGSQEFDRATASELEIKGDAPQGTESWGALEVPASPAVSPALIAKGGELFKKSCVGCHGTEGKGDGPLTKKFDLGSPPANLSKPLKSIKIRTTMSGSVPQDTDLFRTLTRGLPGTAMFSYRTLPAEDRWALVHYIKTLAPDYAKGAPEIVSVPEKPANVAEYRKQGAEFYANVCFNCHGDKGLGGSMPLRDPDTNKVFAGLRFARAGGMEMLGGGSEADIARTLLTGFHSLSFMRSQMAYFYPKDLTPEQKRDADGKFWATVLYVRELIEAQAKAAQNPN